MTSEPLLSAPASVPRAICQVLEDAGIDVVLGIPGGNIVQVFDALVDFRRTIRTMLVREESLAAAMAEVYGRVTGRPAVVMGQGAWILANAGMGMLEALTGSAPMVVLTELSDKVPYSHHNPTQSGTGEYGNWYARQALAGFAKQVIEVHHPAQAVQQTQLAIKQAVTGVPGPVVVLYYAEALRAEVSAESRPRLFAGSGYWHRDRRPAEPEAAALAAATLRSATRPVILAGNGVRVSGAAGELTALAESLGAPVVTTGSGKGVFAECHPLAGGVVGEYGLVAAGVLCGEADVILAVGTRLAPGDTLRLDPDVIDPARQTIIQIDVDPLRTGWSAPVDVALIGDARTVLGQLLDELGRGAAGGLRPGQGAARVQAAFASHGGFDVDESTSTAEPILPQRVIHELNTALAPDVVVTADAGENRIFLVHHLRTRSPGGFVQPGSMAGMGYAIPAALGHKLAEPARPVVAVCGDGGFAMTMNGLMSSLELDLPIVVVVLNNSCLGWVKHVQGDRPIASELGSYDHAAIARAMGCEGLRVTHPADIGGALHTAIGSGRTTVIDIVTSAEETWEKVTHPRASLRAPAPRA